MEKPADIKRVRIADLIKEFSLSVMMGLYAGEAHVPGMPEPAPDYELYQAMEDAGSLQAFGAYADGRLVGFLILIVSPIPHYSVMLATTESIFVLPDYRKYGTGRRLLEAAEEYAKERGCHGIGVTAPRGGRLARGMGAMGYRHTHQVYFRRLDG